MWKYRIRVLCLKRRNVYVIASNNIVLLWYLEKKVNVVHGYSIGTVKVMYSMQGYGKEGQKWDIRHASNWNIDESEEYFSNQHREAGK